ncbi:hypothetical protein pb186bvf_004102 [Paramecium bursaria]
MNIKKSFQYQKYFWKFSDLQPKQTKDIWTRQSYYSKSKSPSKANGPTTAQKKEEDEIKCCTFKPQIYSDNSKYWQEGHADFLQRIQLWQEQKQAKLIKHRLQEVENNLKECTFAPKISEYQRNTPIERRTPQKQERVITQSSDKSPYKYVDALRHLHKTLHS